MDGGYHQHSRPRLLLHITSTEINAIVSAKHIDQLDQGHEISASDYTFLGQLYTLVLISTKCFNVILRHNEGSKHS